MKKLKRSITGKYNASDVDKLLLKVRDDYEQCLKAQKERIITLREENRSLSEELAKYRNNEQYIIGAITRAEETAAAIIRDAQDKAGDILNRAQRQKQVMEMAADGCFERLCSLRAVSEEIYRAITKAVGEQWDKIQPSSNVRPFIGHCENN